MGILYGNFLRKMEYKGIGKDLHNNGYNIGDIKQTTSERFIFIDSIINVFVIVFNQ